MSTIKDFLLRLDAQRFAEAGDVSIAEVTATLHDDYDSVSVIVELQDGRTITAGFDLSSLIDKEAYKAEVERVVRAELDKVFGKIFPRKAP